MCLATVYKESDDSVIFKNVARIDVDGNNPGLKQMKLPALCYDIVIFFMSTCAFALLLARPCVGSALIWIGSLSFIVSDSILAEGIFLSERAHHHFKVMTTYTFAQFAIALGAALM